MIKEKEREIVDKLIDIYHNLLAKNIDKNVAVDFTIAAISEIKKDERSKQIEKQRNQRVYGPMTVDQKRFLLQLGCPEDILERGINKREADLIIKALRSSKNKSK